MRFSFSATNTALDPEDDEAMVEAEMRQVLLADELGFDMVKFGERHFSGYGVANPLQILASVAPRLKQAWVGTGITVAPDHHPVRLAEMINILDHLAKGRVVIGIGSGMSTVDALAFGFDSVTQKKAMLAECLDAMEALWAKQPHDPPVTIETSHYQGTLLERIVPTAYRKRRAHLKISASSEQSIARAARCGWPVYLGVGDADAERATFERYRVALLAEGHEQAVLDHCFGWSSAVTLGLHIAETDEQAREEAQWLLQPTKEWAARRLVADAASERIQGLSANQAGLRHIEARPITEIWDDFVVHGSPETIARRVRGFEELGVGLFQVAFVGQTDPSRRALAERAMRLFAERVMPEFRTASAATA